MPLDTTDIARLAHILAQSDIASIEIEAQGQSLKLVMEDAGGSGPTLLPAATDSSDDAAVVAKADIAGTFVAAHPWRSRPFVEPGQRIDAGAIVGLIKIGLLYAPVLSPAAGIVDTILAEAGTTVGYGSPIVRVLIAA